MTLSGIASHYALALAEAVLAEGSGADPSRALADLELFGQAMEESRDLKLVMTSPGVSPKRKRAVIDRLAKAMDLSRLVRNTLFVLVDHHRLELIGELRHQFALALDEKLGLQRARISAAAPLTGEEEAAIASQLERLTDRRVRMQVEVDPDLIGGALARVGSTVYDGSVRGRLQGLRERLSAETG